jgi:hypothetical protein
MFHEDIDAKNFSTVLTEKVLYNSEITINTDNILISIKDEGSVNE